MTNQTRKRFILLLKVFDIYINTLTLSFQRNESDLYVLQIPIGTA